MSRPDNNYVNQNGSSKAKPQFEESSAIYEEPQMTKTSPVETNKEDVKPSQDSQSKSGLIVILLLGFATILLLVIAVASVLNYTETNAVLSVGVAPSGSDSVINYKSCLELKKSGFNESGIYKINLSAGSDGIEVYCDMKTAGGGWTLVASIVNEAPGQKCSTIYDNWSRNPYSQAARFNRRGSSNWESTSTFGNARSATSLDYKNSAYSSLKATDIMVSHVPNSVPIDYLSSTTRQQYYTSSKFLKEYGSTLSALFYFYAPLRGLSIVGVDKTILLEFQKNLSITSLVPNWSTYDYDAGLNATLIYNGSNLFKGGNKVSFSANGKPYNLISYGKSYTDSLTYHISSAAIQPFITLLSFNAIDGASTSFKMKAESILSPSGGSHGSLYVNTFLYKEMFYQARGHQVYNRGASIPSVAQVFFQIWSKKVLNSYSNSFSAYPTYSSANLTNEMVLNRETKNTLFGYFLLAKKDSNPFDSSHLDNVLKAIVDAIVNSATTDIRILHKPQPLVFPVNIAKGNDSHSQNSGVTPGYIQFRAYDSNGNPYAMCPGVKVDSTADPSKFCIGSANLQNFDYQRCGDFSYWSSLNDHILSDRLPKYGRFVNDLNTAVLIFTRNDDII